MLKRKTALYSPSEGAALRMSVCENPLSTTTCASAVNTVSTAITAKSMGASWLATTMLTTICNNMEPIFSERLHATPEATRSLSCRLASIVRPVVSPEGPQRPDGTSPDRIP